MFLLATWYIYIRHECVTPNYQCGQTEKIAYYNYTACSNYSKCWKTKDLLGGGGHDLNLAIAKRGQISKKKMSVTQNFVCC